MSKLTNRLTKIAADQLLGRKIIDVQYMSNEEAEFHGWYKRPVMFQLDDYTWVYPSMDDEGNNGGSLFSASEYKGIPTNEKEEWVFPVLHVGD
jgi:hypothetical protein